MYKKILFVLMFVILQICSISQSQAQNQNPPNGFISLADFRKETYCNTRKDTIGVGNICLGEIKDGLVFMKRFATCKLWVPIGEAQNCEKLETNVYYSNDVFAIMNEYYKMTKDADKYFGDYFETIRVETKFNAENTILYYTIYGQNKSVTPPREEVRDESQIINIGNAVTCDNYNEDLGCSTGLKQQVSADPQAISKGMNAVPCPCEGNPFNAINGSKVESSIDFKFPIPVSRTYVSNLKNPGIFGSKWRSNFDKSVVVYKNKSGMVKALNFILETDDEILVTSTDGVNFTSYYNDSKQFNIYIDKNKANLVRPNGTLETYSLDTGKIVSEKNKGYTLNYQYDNIGNLSTVTDSYLRTLTFSFISNTNMVKTITSFNGDFYSYTYQNGNISNVKLNNVNIISYQYNGILLTGKIDATGNLFAIFNYDSEGRGIENKWVTSTGQELHKMNFEYNFNQTNITQNNGYRKTHYFTDNKIYYTNFNGYNENTNYDANGYVTSQTDFNGTTTQYTYDSAGRVTNYYKGEKQKTINYDSTNNVILSTTENTAMGKKTATFTYDSNFNVTQKVISNMTENLIYNYSYTNDGRLLSETLPNGLITNYSYYPIDNTTRSGLLKSITTNGSKNISIDNYDNRGNPVSITNNGLTKKISYDIKGKILTETVNGASNNYTYDDNDNLTGINFSTGYILNMTYDSTGRMISISDNMGGSSTFTLDDYTDEVLNTSVYQNNALVKAKNKVVDALDRTTQIFNATNKTSKTMNFTNYFNKPVSISDANGQTSTYNYDYYGNLASYSGNGDTVNNMYDLDDNVININANYQTTRILYDSFGRVMQLINPDSGRHYYTYNATNRTNTETDANNTVHTVVKNLDDSPLTVTHARNGVTETENFTYDNKGQLTGFNNNSGSTLYTRNNVGQVTLKKEAINGKNFNVIYEYDNLGQLTSTTYPSGLIVNYSYNNGFLTAISSGGVDIVNNVNYNTMQKEPVSWTLGSNSVVVSKDPDDLLTGFTDNGLLNQTITTDNLGHVTAINDSTSQNSFNVSLNLSSAIVSGNFNNNNVNYDLTTNNNISSFSDGINTYNINMEYSSNKIINLANSEKIYKFQYDSNGNTITDNKGTYTYDLKNNMVSSSRTVGGVTATGNYSFNALNQRVSKNVSGQVRYFVYNENYQLIGEYDNNGAVIAEYVYFGLRPVAVKNNTSLNIVHTDYLLTPRSVTSGLNGGSMIWQWKNDNPYGNNEANGSIEFNLRFTGQYYDSESGLHYNMFRTYNPELGRYMQSDPIGLSGGFNTYNYVGRNPVNAVDPFGLAQLGVVVVNALDYPSINHVALNVNQKVYDIFPVTDISAIKSFFNEFYSPGDSVRERKVDDFLIDYINKNINLNVYNLNITENQQTKLLNELEKLKGTKYSLMKNTCASFVKTALQNSGIIPDNFNYTWTPTSFENNFFDYLTKNKIPFTLNIVNVDKKNKEAFSNSKKYIQ